MTRIYWCIALTALATAGMAEKSFAVVADVSGFAKYVPIEIGEAYSGASVSNQQVLVRIDDIRIPGFDVRSADTNLLFTSADGYRVYPHEVDSWKPDGASLVWVRLPVLERGARFRMYYGAVDASGGGNAAEVWEGYAGVWHLNGDFSDSVADAGVLLNSNTVAVASAPIGSGFGTLRPDDGPVFVSDATKYIDELVNEGHLAVSMWMCLNHTNTKWTCVFTPRRQSSGDTLGVVFGGKENGDNVTLLNYDRVHAKTVDTTGKFPLGEWHKLDFAFSMTNIVFYLDGARYFTAEDMDEPKINWIKWLPWGGCSHGGEYIIYDPLYAPTAALSFDECRVSGVLPDADRVAANYLVETVDVCEIGPPAASGDESGVTCSFEAIGVTSGTFPLEVAFQAAAEIRGTDLAPVYEWDFDGDGIYETVTNVSSISHVFASPGRHSVALRVSVGEYDNTFVLADVVSTTGDIYADGSAAVNGDGTAERPFNRLEDALDFVDCTDHIRLRGEFIYNPAVSRVFARRGFIFEKWGDGPNPVVRMINGTKAEHMVGTFRIDADDVLVSGIDFHYNLEAQSAGPFFNVNGNNVTFRGCTFRQITWVRDGGGSYATISVLDEGNSLDTLTGLLIDGCTFENINAGYTGSYPVLRPGKNTRVVDSTFTRCASILMPSRIWWSGEELNFISNRVFDSVCYVAATSPSNYVDSGSVMSYCRNNGWGWPNRLNVAYNVFSNGAHRAASAVSVPIGSFYQGPLVLHHNTFVGYDCAVDLVAETDDRTGEFRIFDNLLEKDVPVFTNRHGIAVKPGSFLSGNLSRRTSFGSFDPGSARFARPRGEWFADGWTDGGLYPGYVGAKPPLPPPGTMVFFLGGVSRDPGSGIPEADDGPGSAGDSPWRIEILDPTHLAVKYDCHYDELTNYLSNGKVQLNRRFGICDMLTNGTFEVSGSGVEKCGSSTVLNGQSFFPAVDGRTAIVKDTSKKDQPVDISPYADTVVHTFVALANPLQEGVENLLVTPDGCRIPFVYSALTPTPLFKVNQVGYAASAGEKYVYLGGWMGTGGAFPLEDSYAFDLVNAANGAVVLSGTFVHRMDDPVWTNGSSFVPLTGEKTLEADISAVTTPGEYYVRVAGVGRSHTFRVSDDAMAEHFSAHMHGLFNHRCGCEKRDPYTHHHDRACHLGILRGVQPSNDDEYRTSFKDATGEVVQESGFSIIKANISDCREKLSLPGGWHDAADYDRRPFHLNIVNELCETYLMRPENFKDGQLVIPENNNGIPDILDEADWGLRHILGGQQADGGAGVWIETVRHPTYVDGQLPSEDGLVYCLARATKRSTLQYCAMASLLARALYRSGSDVARERADIYYASAVRAWNFVQTAEWQKNVTMKGSNGIVTYNETKWINPLDYVKAIVNLAEISRDTGYFDHLQDKIAYSQGGADRGPAGLSQGTVAYLFYNPCVGYETLGRSAYYLNELLLPSDFSDYYLDQTKQWRGKIVENAEVLLHQMTNSMPYRTPWYEAANSQFVNMSWGALVPLRRATWFCSAHFATGEAKYLDAAYLAADFHAGCNPHGMTWTSGLGRVYPVKFLSLHSLVDGVDEYVDGVTPYHNTFALGNFFALFNRMYTYFPNIWTEANAKPAWRRWENVESMTVNASEYTVWETISPCAAATGYLMKPGHNSPPLVLRPAARRMSDQPGYWALP